MKRGVRLDFKVGVGPTPNFNGLKGDRNQATKPNMVGVAVVLNGRCSFRIPLEDISKFVPAPFPFLLEFDFQEAAHLLDIWLIIHPMLLGRGSLN